MLGTKQLKDIPKDLESWTYEKTRYNLILNSAGFKRLIKRLRKKYKLAKFSKRELDLEFMEYGPLIKGTLRDNINNICAELNITNDFLERVIQNEYEGFYVGGDSLPIYIANGEPFRDGFYIRVDRHTPWKTVKSAFKILKDDFRMLDKEYKQEGTLPSGLRRPSTATHRERKQKDLPIQYYRFIKIEDKIFSLARDFKDRGKTASSLQEEFMDVKSSNAVVSAAIEEASYTLVKKKLVSSKNFEEQKAETESKYYRTLNHYLIPTFIDFENFHLS